MRDMSYESSPPPTTDCGQCMAWYAEYQRAALLLERLAEDHFPDQAAFDAWIKRQVQLILTLTTPEASRG